MKATRILIVEDNRALSLALAAAVSQSGATTEIVATATQAREKLENARFPFAAMILDIGLPDQNGLQFLESLPASCRPPTLVITAHGELDNTIQARKLGVQEFFTKPLDFEHFKTSISRLIHQVAESSKEAENSTAYIGAAPSMRSVFQQIAHACASHDPVLITGQTGTGKSLTAELIHHNGPQAGGRRVFFRPPSQNQTEELNQALEKAQKGVLILDDLGDLEMDAQTELIRQWEQEPESFPRILAISGRNPREAVEKGECRSDLFYRLQVLEVRLPSLVERIEDLPALFSFFLAQLQPGRGFTIEDEVMNYLQSHNWTGNLRELRNVASFVITSCSSGSIISPQHLPEYLLSDVPNSDMESRDDLDHALDQWLDQSGSLDSYKDLSEELERKLIQQLLRRFDGKLARMANRMNANRTTLRKKIRSGVSE